MAGQDFDKDLVLVIAGNGDTTIKNIVSNLEGYIYGDRDEREVTLLIPYTQDMGKGMDVLLNRWAVGTSRTDPSYPFTAFVEPEAGHRSISSAEVVHAIPHTQGVVSQSAAFEAAMAELLVAHEAGKETAVVILYDQNKDVDLVGDAKNYNWANTYNLCEGMIDFFPGFKTTDEQLAEEREKEEFDAKEAERIAAEKAEEASKKPVKKAAAPRKRVAAKKVAAPVEKPLTERLDALVAESVAKEQTPKTVEELQAELLAEKSVPSEDDRWSDTDEHKLETEIKSVTATNMADVWEDLSTAHAALDSGVVTHYSVRKDNLVALGEGIQDMAMAFAKTIDALTKIVDAQ